MGVAESLRDDKLTRDQAFQHRGRRREERRSGSRQGGGTREARRADPEENLKGPRRQNCWAGRANGLGKWEESGRSLREIPADRVRSCGVNTSQGLCLRKSKENEMIV